MEINLRNIVNNLTSKQKTLLEGIVRSCAFLILMREFDNFIIEYITIPIMKVIVGYFSAVDVFLNPEPTDEPIDAFALIIVGIIFFVFNTYIIAKFCGLLKYFSRFKFWKSFLFLLLISITYYYFSYLNLHTLKLNFDSREAGGIFVVASIIPAYITFLFFNFLTKKFPTPFEQIGYVFSFECCKNIFFKIKTRLKDKNCLK